MKINVCDVCLKEGKRTPARWLIRVKRSFESLRIDICATHRETVKGIGYDAALEVLVAAERAYNAEILK